MVNMGELFAHPRISEIEMDRVPLSDSEAERFLLEPGDLLFARQSLVLEGAGQCSIYLGGAEPATFESHIIRVRLDKQIADPLFYFYYFQSPRGRSAIRSIVEQGAGAAGVRSRDLTSLTVDRFPIVRQRAIASILGSLDEKIEHNRRTARVLERLARAIFKAWFVDFEPVKAKAEGAASFPSMPQEVFDALPTTFVDTEIGLVPEGWGVKALPAAFEINPKRTLQKGESSPYLAMTDMPTMGHAPELWTTCEYGSGMRFMNGDTLVARITPCLENGKTAFVDFLEEGQVGWGSTEYLVMRPRSPLPPIFAYCLARTSEFRNFAIQNMTGTSGRQRVSASAFEHYDIAIPPMPAAMAFNVVVVSMFKCIRTLMDESGKLAQARSYLLARLLIRECNSPVDTAL